MDANVAEFFFLVHFETDEQTSKTAGGFSMSDDEWHLFVRGAESMGTNSIFVYLSVMVIGNNGAFTMNYRHLEHGYMSH
jgi:hypothetical protein